MENIHDFELKEMDFYKGNSRNDQTMYTFTQ